MLELMKKIHNLTKLLNYLHFQKVQIKSFLRICRMWSDFNYLTIFHHAKDWSALRVKTLSRHFRKIQYKVWQLSSPFQNMTVDYMKITSILESTQLINQLKWIKNQKTALQLRTIRIRNRSITTDFIDSNLFFNASTHNIEIWPLITQKSINLRIGTTNRPMKINQKLNNSLIAENIKSLKPVHHDRFYLF